MNSHILKSVLVAALVAGSAAAASAQELKIGYVNSDRVLREAVPAKAAQSKSVKSGLSMPSPLDGMAYQTVTTRRL